MIRELLALFVSETHAHIDDKALNELVDYVSIEPQKTLIYLQRKNLSWAKKMPTPSKESLDNSADWIISKTIRNREARTFF